jgi:shikimate dehydrogenase
MGLSGAARVAGVMGWPVKHTRSPQLHGYWLEKYRIDGAYVPLAVTPNDLPAALRNLCRVGIAGVNLTVPHKEQAFTIADHLDPLARRIGAINTIVVRGDGSLEGSNTDAFGFIENVRQGAPGWSPAAPAVVIGAGGAARAVIVALLDAGVRDVRIVNRTRERAAQLAEELGAGTHGWGDWRKALDGAGLLVNTTTQGMAGEPALDIDLAALPKNAVVNDIVYVPLETPLLATARRRGHPVVDGLGMLLHQARPGFRAWFGVDPEVTPELRKHVSAGLGG